MPEYFKILKANPHHDAQGRFSSASASGKAGKPWGAGGSGSDAKSKDKSGSGDGSDKKKDAPTDTDLNNDGYREGNHLTAISASLKKKGFKKEKEVYENEKGDGGAGTKGNSNYTTQYHYKGNDGVRVRFSKQDNETEWTYS